MRDRERRLHTVATRMTVRQRVAALLAAGPEGTALHDDIGRGLTPAGWAAFRRYGERVDQLNATAGDVLARAANRSPNRYRISAASADHGCKPPAWESGGPTYARC